MKCFLSQELSCIFKQKKIVKLAGEDEIKDALKLRGEDEIKLGGKDEIEEMLKNFGEDQFKDNKVTSTRLLSFIGNQGKK